MANHGGQVGRLRDAQHGTNDLREPGLVERQRIECQADLVVDHWVEAIDPLPHALAPFRSHAAR